MACNSSSSMTNEEIKLRILNNYAKFVSDAEPDRLSDWLVQDGVISIEQSHKIKHENSTNPDRCRALFNHLFSTQHPTAFLTVREALRERNHYLLQCIDSQESGYEPHGQSEPGVFSQVVLEEERNDEDQKKTWEDEKDRLLNIQGELETKILVEDQRSEERRKREETKIMTLEANTEKLKQNLNSEKMKNKELRTEFEKLRQKLNNETKSNKSCQIDLNRLKQKIANERERAKQLEKMTEDQKSEERSKREQTKIRALEANTEKLKQELNSEKMKNKALRTESEKFRQELNSETKSKKSCQIDLETLMQKIANERERAKQLEKTMTAFQSWMSKLELKKPERQEKEQLIAKALEEKKKFDELRYKWDPVLVQTIRTRAAVEQNKEIRGLAILDKEFFIVSDESSEVEVYNSITFSFSRRWILKELIHPEEIVSCSRNKCLYIIDFKVTGQSKEILRVDPKGKLIKKWSTGDDCGWYMSVTEESNVILTVHDKNKLNEYSPDGQLIREINLSSGAGIQYPRGAIKLANGHFLVSYGRYAGEQQGVCVIDAEAKLKKSFGGKPGSTVGNICDPVYMYLAIDGNGFVLVADQNNSRVLLLDSDLQFKREILSKDRHGLERPYGIFLDETNGRLFAQDGKLNPKNNLCSDTSILIFDF